jgi:hypothetical protein
MKRGSTPPPGFTFVGTWWAPFGERADFSYGGSSWSAIDIYIKN